RRTPTPAAFEPVRPPCATMLSGSGCMLFPTVDYALFFLVVFALAWAFRRPLALHKLLLLTASYVFYGLWDWRFLPLLAGISLLSAVVARALQRPLGAASKKAWLSTGITLALSTLGFFKYRGFA